MNYIDIFAGVMLVMTLLAILMIAYIVAKKSKIDDYPHTDYMEDTKDV